MGFFFTPSKHERFPPLPRRDFLWGRSQSPDSLTGRAPLSQRAGLRGVPRFPNVCHLSGAKGTSTAHAFLRGPLGLAACSLAHRLLLSLNGMHCFVPLPGCSNLLSHHTTAVTSRRLHHLHQPHYNNCHHQHCCCHPLVTKWTDPISMVILCVSVWHSSHIQ